MKHIIITSLAVSLICGSVIGAFAAEKSGVFRGADGEHVSGSAKWSVTGGKSTISLTANFKASPGPDLYVYVGNGKPSRIVGKLRRHKGAQKYTVPAGLKQSSYSKIYIHCKKYNHTFGAAKLN